MKYKINVHYQTGNSFGTSEIREFLDYEWENLDIAKECLRRIKDHYAWYESVENPRRDKVEKPTWHNIKDDDMGFTHCMINLPLDNGKEVQFWCMWCGYFEQLFGAEIIPDETDMKFELLTSCQ